MSKSSIEWTDVTDNIIVVKGGGWWCRKISDGCKNCYAAKLNQSSYFGGNKLAYSGEAPELELRREMMAGWARQAKPKKHFVASMTDVFGEWVPAEWVFEMLDAMAAAPLQTFQVLTKRPVVARLTIIPWLAQKGLAELPGNIWIGTSVENQKAADERIPELLQIPAKVRFLSCEPLLGAVDLTRDGLVCVPCVNALDGLPTDPETGAQECCKKCDYTGIGDEWGIDWVICGGESGPEARPMHPEWARSLRDQCNAAKVPFFFKQWGEWLPSAGWLEDDMASITRHPYGKDRYAVMCSPAFTSASYYKGPQRLDGREWSEFPNATKSETLPGDDVEEDDPDDVEDSRPADDWCRAQGWEGVQDCPHCSCGESFDGGVCRTCGGDGIIDQH